jgi:hypothetical protein
LNIKSETHTHKKDVLWKPNESIHNLRRDAETKWAQLVNVKHIQEGGDITKCFHLIANGKQRKK